MKAESTQQGYDGGANVQYAQVAILGGGPAGVQLAYCLQKAGVDYVLIERASSCGSFFKRHPRHGKLLSINKRFTGYPDRERQLRWDWNSLLSDDGELFTERSADYFPESSLLADYIDDFARNHSLNLSLNQWVDRIEQRGNAEGGYRLITREGKIFQCSHLVVATGFSLPHVPDIEGIEHAVPYTEMSVDPHDFEDQRVLILGKGNSAFETADNLIGATRSIHLVSPEPVRLAWRTHYVGDLRAVNNNFIDTYQLKSQNALLDAHVERIERRGSEYVVTVRYIHNDETEELIYDRVLSCTGFRVDVSTFAPGCRPEVTPCGRLPLQTCEWESANLPNLFFGGTLMQMRDHHRTTSAFIHGFRYNMRALAKILESRVKGTVGWRASEIAPDLDALTNAILERINTSSALWQQFGFLADVLVLRDGSCELLEEVPVDYLLERDPFEAPELLTITLEYGEHHGADPLVTTGRVHRAATDMADSSVFLHPVVRHYRGDRLLATHHILEDLAAEWMEPEHVAPLRAFLDRQLFAAPRYSGVRDLRPAAEGEGLRHSG